MVKTVIFGHFCTFTQQNSGMPKTVGRGCHFYIKKVNKNCQSAVHRILQNRRQEIIDFRHFRQNGQILLVNFDRKHGTITGLFARFLRSFGVILAVFVAILVSF